MWYYEDRPSLEDKKIEAFFLKTTQNADLARGLSRFWNLYHYLATTNPTSSKLIRETVLMNQIDKKPFFSEDASERVFQLMPITKDPKKYINIINVIKNLVSLGYNHITTEINSIKIIVSSLPGLYNLNNIGRMKNKYIKEVKKSYNICIPIDCKSKYDDIEGLNENKDVHDPESQTNVLLSTLLMLSML